MQNPVPLHDLPFAICIIFSVFFFSPNFQFVFEGITGANFDSDIALDDIFITSGACTGNSLMNYNYLNDLDSIK